MLSSCTLDANMKKAKENVSIKKKDFPNFIAETKLEFTGKKKLELCDVLQVGDFVKVLEMFETRGNC